MSWRLGLTLLAAGCVWSCATAGPFTTTFPVGGARVGQTMTEAKAHKNPVLRPLIVGVADAPRSLFAYDLGAGQMLFRTAANVNGLPSIAGELIAVPEVDKVTIRRLRDGSVLRELPLDGMHLIGADGDATTSAIVLSTGGTMNARSRLLIVQGEQVTLDREIKRALGAPAVLGGISFVPHNRVHVSAIDAHGNELARVRAQDDVASEAFTRDGEVYFGQRGFYRLDAETERGAKNGAHFWKLELKHKLPGAPPLIGDSTEPKPQIESALHRVRLAFAPVTRGEAPALLDDALYLAFYKQLFALTPDGSAAKWVHDTENDVVGMHAIDGGVLAVETSGQISAIDGAGLVTYSENLGLTPIAVAIRAERFDRGAPSGEAGSLAEQLERAARNPDTRLVPSRTFAALLLGAVDDDQAARSLIALCSGDAPQRVREEACETLAKRKLPSDAVVEALGRHADYLASQGAPPVAALALAALHGQDKRALPGLIAQLQDPATEEDQLPALLRALAGLGDESTATPVAAFVRLYHAETVDDRFEEVLAIGMDALVKLDRERARYALETISNDGFARVGVRTAAQKRLQALPPAPRAEGEEAEPAAAAAAGAKPSAPVDPGPPANLTAQHVDEALSPVRTQLSRCVADAPQHPASARLVIVIDGEGKVSDVRALPESVLSCVGPLVRGTNFPATKYGKRSVMNYSIGM